MLIVAVLTIVAFAWLYNPAETTELGSNVAVRVYGQIYTPADVERISRSYDLALGMGLLEMVTGLASRGADGEDSLSEYVINLIVMRHEAAKMGIQVGKEQVAQRIRGLAPFQSGGKFDPAKFEMLMSEKLGPRGLTTLALEQVVVDALVFDRLRELVGAPAVLGKGDLAKAERMVAPVDLVIGRISAEPVVSGIQIPEEQSRAFFERNEQSFRKPEMVAVEAAVFELSAEKSGLGGKERVAALQELAGKAAEFAERARGADFRGAAGAAGARVINSPLFERGDLGASGMPSEVARAAFFLQEVGAMSDVIQSGDNFYVLHLVDRVPESPMTFEEARLRIEDGLKRMEAERVMRDQALRAVPGIRSAIARGVAMVEAFREVGMNPEIERGVRPDNPSLARRLMLAARVSTLLDRGEVSNPFPDEGDVVMVGVERRGEAQPDAGDLRGLLEEQRDLIFKIWLQAKRTEANVTVPQRRR